MDTLELISILSQAPSGPRQETTFKVALYQDWCLRKRRNVSSGGKGLRLLSISFSSNFYLTRAVWFGNNEKDCFMWQEDRRVLLSLVLRLNTKAHVPETEGRREQWERI